MKRSYRKIIGRSIKKSMGRFLSVFAITALGVGFLAGLISTTPDMKYTIDQYYDEAHFFDIFLKSTAGFTEKDVEAVSGVDEISKAEGVFVMDAMMEDQNGESHVARLTGTDFTEMQKKDSEAFNQLELKEGKWPENENECVVEYTKPVQDTPVIGDTITITEDNKDVDDTYNVKTYTVTGFVENPEYFSLEDEPTTVGSGKINLLVYVYDSAFALDYFTEIQASVEGADEENAFTDAYGDKIDAAMDSLEELAGRREIVRYNEIVDEAHEVLREKRQDYRKEKAKTLKKLSDAQKKIDDGKQEIADGEKEISDGEKSLAENQKKLSDGQKELEKGQKEIETGEKELASAKKKLASAKKELEKNKKASEKELASAKKKLDFARSELEKQETELASAKEQLDASAGEIEKAREAIASGMLDEETEQAMQQQVTEYESGLAAYNTGKEKLDSAKTELEKQEKTYTSSKKKAEKELAKAEKKIAAGEKEITENEKKIAEAKKKLSASQKELEDGKKKLSSAKSELAEAKTKLQDAQNTITESQNKLDKNQKKADKELAKAEKKLQDAEDEIEDIDKVTWYVMDRNSNVGYVSFYGNVDKVASIAKVFPVFFFLIAALVVLTTMTRMVEEERTEIGVIKALGYSNVTIASKYLLYAALAAILGAAVGLAAGTHLFPMVIWNAYGIMYTFPPLVCRMDPLICLGTSGILVIGVVGATLYASLDVLRGKPAALMLPKAPKPGKRVFLEYICPVWRRMKFTHKVTARNLLRYKKRFFMTILGVAGCTALLVTGFGLRDSIGDIVERQYGTLQKFDLEIRTDEEADLEGSSALADYLKDDSEQDGYLRVHKSSAELYFANGEGDITLVVPEETEKMKDFRTLQNRQTKENVPFETDSVILTEKVAERLGISAGDTVSLKNSDDKSAEFTVTDIVENYISSYVFMGVDAYRAAFEEEPEYLYLDVKNSLDGEEERDALSAELLEDSSITNLQFSEDSRETFGNMLGKIDYIVVVLIICAGLLAFIVLYDLTNINVSERQKEIATIKVLGFYDHEVSAYIYRETVVLSIIGTIAGLVFGIFLHAFVVRTAEMDSFMFGRQIYPASFALAAVITMLFSMIVNLVMGRKMRRIDMAESMKAVD